MVPHGLLPVLQMLPLVSSMQSDSSSVKAAHIPLIKPGTDAPETTHVSDMACFADAASGAQHAV